MCILRVGLQFLCPSRFLHAFVGGHLAALHLTSFGQYRPTYGEQNRTAIVQYWSYPGATNVTIHTTHHR